ncbi:MAG: 6-bladed beta-propeller [Gracilimonas sp.]|uniref:6-bladed beta-propeller n=1 Tax=Gracilimonas sp. TaxID=1974203 RepID=UPI0019A1BE6E|nr:6-bladed beta-propeller [Gracilimonas sp.]MBD3615536.1 6-bladed beta-propeller [Gracilimonas sp.]
MNKFFIPLVLSLLLSFCNNNNESRIHPNSENIPNPELEGEHIINKKINDFSNLDFSSDQYSFTETLGDERNIGFINDVEVDKSGRIFVLDDRQQKVLVYSSEGDFLQAIGRRGQGPGELSYAKSITLYQDSLLLISNRFRIEEYDISSDSISFNRTVNFEISIKSICTTNEVLYIHNLDVLDSGQMSSEMRKTNMLHEFTLPQYSHQSTFGESYISDSPVIVDRLTQGDIICDPYNNMLIYISDRVNILKGYSLSNGEQMWKSSIADLNFPKIEEIVTDGSPGLKILPPENDIFDNFLKPVLIKDGFILVQVDRREVVERESLESKSSILSYLIDAKTGKGHYYSDKLDRMLYFSENSIIEVNDSFTELEIKYKETQ